MVYFGNFEVDLLNKIHSCVHCTGISFSEARNIWMSKQKQKTIYVHIMLSWCSEQFSIFMNNLSSYCGLVNAKIRASDRDSPVVYSFCISHRSGKFHNDTRATSKLIHTWLIKCIAQKDGSKLRSYYSFHGPFCQKQDFQERSCSGSSGMAHTMSSNNFWRSILIFINLLFLHTGSNHKF